MNEPPLQVVCVACSIFRRELESLRESGEIDFPIRYLDSMLHMQPLELRRRLDAAIDDPRPQGSTVLLVYGECHNHMNEYELGPGVRRVKGRNCVEIILGGDRYRALRRAGTFFLLPEWTLRWREVFEKELDLPEKIAKDFMRGMHTKLLYLDTGQVPVPTEHLEEASEVLGLPCEVLRVELEHLLAGIREALEKKEQP